MVFYFLFFFCCCCSVLKNQSVKFIAKAFSLMKIEEFALLPLLLLPLASIFSPFVKHFQIFKKGLKIRKMVHTQTVLKLYL